MEDVAGDKNFILQLTMDEVLETVMEQCMLARDASDDRVLGVRLKMASRALRCALEIYGSRVLKTEEAK